MMTNATTIAVLTTVAVAASGAVALAQDSAATRRAGPGANAVRLQTTRTVSFTTTEGTWYEHQDIHDDPKVVRFMPHTDVDQRSVRRSQWFRDDQYVFRQMAEQARKILDAGGRVGLGGHRQMQGLGVHWELWSLAVGGVKPLDVIRIGTQLSAEVWPRAKAAEQGRWLREMAAPRPR